MQVPAVHVHTYSRQRDRLTIALQCRVISHRTVQQPRTVNSKRKAILQPSSQAPPNTPSQTLPTSFATRAWPSSASYHRPARGPRLPPSKQHKTRHHRTSSLVHRKHRSRPATLRFVETASCSVQANGGCGWQPLCQTGQTSLYVR